MPQETNLNVAPYFDDFNSEDNYCKILFKPGLPVQARELTGIQSILQNQIEKFGEHIFKDGASVTGGGVVYNPGCQSVRIEKFNEGIDVNSYIYDFNLQDSVVVIGSESGVKAKIKQVSGQSQLGADWYILYVQYLNTGGEDNTEFVPGESLLLDQDVFETLGPDGETALTFQPGETLAQVVSEDATFTGASATLSAGVYYIRGYFIEVEEQTIILDPYGIDDINLRIGLQIDESIINANIDPSLSDNAAGFSNYTAPGADRLSIQVNLTALPYDNSKTSNFIELMVVIGGVLAHVTTKTDYNKIEEEFARRTFDESGNYYVKPYSVTPRNTLNDYEGNDGIFNSDQTTYNNQIPSEDLGTYKISPGKAFVEGYEVETVVPAFLDFPKTRAVKVLENQSLNYVSGPTFTLNRVSGSPTIGIGTNYTVSLRDSRIGAATTTSAGKEVGLARVYDFALESGSYNTSTPNENEWDIALYDIQTYTNITLNTAATLSVPTHIKGKSSGATGYLRYDVSSGTGVTAYNTKGTFIVGEQFIFNGIENGNISVGSTSYTSSDIKSIHGTVSTASTFNADVKQNLLTNFGEVSVSAATTSGTYLGISTVTSTDATKFFVGIATVGNIVSYTNPNISGVTTSSYARVESVSKNSLTISGVTTVGGICEGGLPLITINPSNFKILSSRFHSSEDNNLYTQFPKNNVKSVDLTNSHITIRKQFDVNITDGTTGSILTGSPHETFLPYDEEDYILIRTDGTTESLSSDKFDFNTGSTELIINGLGANSSAKLVATIRKVNVTEKIKEKKKINVLTITKSQNSQSGIGSTTLNDGLTYSTVYGTRVQDEEISLNVPDVMKVYGILESKNSSEPAFSQIALIAINSSTAKTGDLLIGDRFSGKSSKCNGIYVSRVDDSTINYIKLNDYEFQLNEEIIFQESGITATTSSLIIGSENITQEFTYDDGQRNTIYDFARLVRKSNFNPPTKQLKIVFESAYFSAADAGDLTTPSSYKNFDYGDLPEINDTRVSDILDIRPRVSDFSGTSRSPFEFLGRNFTADGNSAKNILASDKSILLGYEFYLPRLDRIYLSKDGTFQLMQGTPAENPEYPATIDGALQVASIELPAYLYSVTDASITLASYKRYQMSDINKLEKRIENLEFYTSLSLLESNTLNLNITDSDGLNRFKSGFFVDDFSNTDNQIKETIVKNSIDYRNGELRPSPHTTEIDLQLDLNSANNIRKTGNVLSLDYEDVIQLNQPFATRVENVTPYLVNYYGGKVFLTPESDIWIDEVVLTAKQKELTTYTNTSSQLNAAEFDKRTGYSPVVWGAWKMNWTGYEHVDNKSNTRWEGRELVRRTTTTKQRIGTKKRTGTKKLVRETFSTVNEGDKILNSELVSYLRSRNIKFDAQKLKPNTGLYAFFDGQDIAKYIIPKLLEISMTTGTFAVGETVIGMTNNGKEIVRFKVAKSNHKKGPFNEPTHVYKANPYYQFTPLYKGTTLLLDSIVPTQSSSANVPPVNNSASSAVVNVPELYSSTSTILNVDLDSLSDKADNTYFGYVEKGLKLVGQTSNAQASISNLRLRSDISGSVFGSLFIPNPNEITNPKFDSGKKVFRITSSPFNSQIPGNVQTDATTVFESSGSINTTQGTIISVRNIATDILTRVETSTARGETTSVTSTAVVDRLPPSPPPPPIKPPEVDVVIIPPKIIPPKPVIILPPPPAPQDFVTRAYIAVFNRKPDGGGHHYWKNQVISDMAKLGITPGSSRFEHKAYQKVVWYLERSQESLDKKVEAKGWNQKKMDAVKKMNANRKFNKNTRKRFGYTAKQYKSWPKNKFGCPTGEDPLAQSFRIEDTSGIYVTKIDLYFASKDQFLPVSVQLRPMQAGVPQNLILPFGEIILDPDDVNISDDASVATTVTFNAPVYLSPNQSYSVVLLSISNEYTAWISRMGETEIQTVDKPESERVIVSSQPTLGSLFKSQNGETWNPSQYEDLKFTLYKAKFLSETGSINFHNPSLLTYSEDIGPLLKDPFEISSNKIRIGFNTTISDTGVTFGNIIQQDGSNASGRYVGAAGTASGNLTITNSGVGYTPSSGAVTYQNVSLNTITGYGRNATANLTISNGVASAATILSGGSGYVIGDVVGITSVGINSLGRNIKFSIAAVTGTNEWVLDNVQGEFSSGVGKTIQYVTGAGTTILNYAAGGNVWLSGAPVTDTDGLHIKVNQKNHGMYFTQNKVTFADVETDVAPTQLAADYDSSSTGSIIVDDASDFAEFEGVGIGSTNLGYVKIGSEILSYSGVVSNTLTGVVRGVDSTQTLSHSADDFLRKYELNGISLRRINTNHDFTDVTESNAIGMDYYKIKVDTSTNGVNRSVGTSLPVLKFNETKSAGGVNALSTENIPFEILTPIVQNMTPSGTNVTGSIRTVTGSSVDGSEAPYQDQGFEDINLYGDNFMSTPRIIASKINEEASLVTLPNNKSFTLSLNLFGTDETVSPIVDLERIGVILTSNRIDNPVDDWVTDNKVNTLKQDPNSFVYATEPITLKEGSSSIKILLEGHINVSSDLRALYAISDDPNEELVYQLFPGHTNLTQTGQIVDPAKNNGLPSKFIPKTDKVAYLSGDLVWHDYEWNIDDLPTFKYFSIKLVGTGTNQAQPPRVKNLRVLALA